MENTIYTLAFLTITALAYGFFAWNSKAQKRLEAIQGGMVTSKYETFFGKYVTVNYIRFRTSPQVYAQLSVGMTFPLQQ